MTRVRIICFCIICSLLCSIFLRYVKTKNLLNFNVPIILLSDARMASWRLHWPCTSSNLPGIFNKPATSSKSSSIQNQVDLSSSDQRRLCSIMCHYQSVSSHKIGIILILYHSSSPSLLEMTISFILYFCIRLDFLHTYITFKKKHRIESILPFYPFYNKC